MILSRTENMPMTHVSPKKSAMMMSLFLLAFKVFMRSQASPFLDLVLYSPLNFSLTIFMVGLLFKNSVPRYQMEALKVSIGGIST